MIMINRNTVVFCASIMVCLLSFSSDLSLANNKIPQPLSDSDFRAVNLKAAKLGQLLFYDKILSGNKILHVLPVITTA